MLPEKSIIIMETLRFLPRYIWLENDWRGEPDILLENAAEEDLAAVNGRIFPFSFREVAVDRGAPSLFILGFG